nr:MAG TPA: hypothetical protein [Caudoviricetes sp.]
MHIESSFDLIIISYLSTTCNSVLNMIYYKQLKVVF